MDIINIPQSHSFQPVGFCIYCGVRESESVELIKEHIIPKSLGGELLLPKSSCVECAKKTAKIEGYIGRNLFWHYRIIEDLRSRRPKSDRPDQMPHRVRLKDKQIIDVVSRIDDFPGTICMPIFPMPSIFNSQFHVVDPYANWDKYVISSWVRENTSWPTQAEVNNLRIKIEIHVDKFAKLLAKIAHSFASGMRDEFPFEPMLCDIIVGNDQRYAYLIGGEYLKADTEDSNFKMAICYKNILKQRYVCVRLCIFPRLGRKDKPGSGAPVYWVVVGKAL